jgi:hypothetical protein
MNKLATQINSFASKVSMNKKSFAMDEEVFLNELLTVAVNDGDAYKDNKNAEKAAFDAYMTFKRYLDENLRDIYRSNKKKLQRDILKNWSGK